MAEDTELTIDTTEVLEEETGILEGLEGLEAEFYRDFKFRVLMYEGVLHADEIVKKGFRLDRDFIEKVVIDEVIFSQLSQPTRRKYKLLSHKDLDALYPDTEEGKEEKRREQEIIFDRFVQEKSLGSKSSKDEQEMFKDAFDLTKKAWKKQGGFSSDDFHRFAKNRASDPELVKIYKKWFETIFSSAAMLCWEAIRLRKNPEIVELKKEAAKEAIEEEPKGEETAAVVVSPVMKFASVATLSFLVLSIIFYFTVSVLLKEKEKLPDTHGPALYEKMDFSHLCGKKWAHNPANDLTLLANNKVSLKKYPVDVMESEKKVFYPLIQGPYEAHLDFKDRLDAHKNILEKCGYKVEFVDGPEGALLEKEKKYMDTVEECLKSISPQKADSQGAAPEAGLN